MKRAAPWEQSYTTSSDDSSDSDSESDELFPTRSSAKAGGSQSSKNITSEGDGPEKKRQGSMDYEDLRRHGYRGGPSILKVPPPRVVVEEREQDWSWSTGKRRDADGHASEESAEERERTRAAVARGEKLLDVQTSWQAGRKEKNPSFSQKEKRKRDLGQASRGKSYVEEEKRLLRDNGVYSGFDS